MSYESSDQRPWRFVTNHTQVLLTIVRNPEIRTREIADQVSLTERAVQRIVADLIERAASKRPRSDGETTTR